MRKIFLFFLIMLLVCGYTFGIIILNETDVAYAIQTPGQDPKFHCAFSLKGYIIEGAIYFLKSKSSYTSFLAEFELFEIQNVNFNALQNHLNDAILYLEIAKYAYENLKNTAQTTPYNYSIIEKLKSFDYEGYFEERGLNQFEFEKVKKYLENGNITGLYSENYANIEKLLLMLYKLKEKFEFSMPNTIYIFDVNKMFSDIHLSGQIATEVFLKIK